MDYIEGTSCPIKEKKHRSTSKSKKEKDERKKDKGTKGIQLFTIQII